MSDTTGQAPILSDAHRHMLEAESCIDPDVIAERGYRTITNPGELQRLGFGRTQRRVPTLLIPLWGPDGTPAGFQHRPDNPRETHAKDGKVQVHKYENTAGQPVRIDCPPRCRPLLADPKVPLWITEGVKKVDCLASLGVCAVGLAGVWGFKSKNPLGGVAVSADLDYIPLNDGREVRIVYDSDVMVKPGVRLAAERLAEHARRKGALVRMVYLPQTDGRKVGVDDFVAEGHTAADLEALVEAPRPAAKATPPTIELLDAAPETMRRPLALVDGRAYVAAHLPCRVTIREYADRKTGEITVFAEPIVTTEHRLFVIRDDGEVFGEPDNPLEALGFEVQLPELPRGAGTLSTAGFRRYRAGYRPDVADLVERIAGVYDRYIDFGRSLGDQGTMCRFAAVLSLATWFLPAWTVVGYGWFSGEKGSGKTQAGTVWALTSCLGRVTLTSGTFAALRDLAEAGAALLFDDAEVLSDPKRVDPAKRELALAGYRRGALVPLKELDADKVWRIKWVDAFAPRGFTAIGHPDNVLASRCIVIPLVRTADPRRGNADPANTERWPCDRDALLDDCWLMGLSLVGEAAEVWGELEGEIDAIGRDFEVWRWLVATARLLDRHGTQALEATVRGVMAAYAAERADLLGDDWAVAVVRALVAHAEGELKSDGVLVAGADGVTAWASDTKDASDASDTSLRGWTLSASQVSATVQSAGGQDDDAEASWATPSKVGRLLAHLRLKAVREPGKKRTRGWQFTLRDVTGLARAYHVDTILLQGREPDTGGASDTTPDTSSDPHKLVSLVSDESLVSDDQGNGNGHSAPEPDPERWVVY